VLLQTPKGASLVVAFLTLFSALPGCISIPGKNGTAHYLIVGFGIVSVNESLAQAVIATDSHVLGISISDQPGLKLAVGYSASTVISIADGADDVRVEVSKFPGGPLNVDVPSVKLMKHAHPKGDGENEGSR